MEQPDQFERIVSAMVARFFGQNGRPAPSGVQLARFAGQLRALIQERGLPRPLGPDECGAPGGMAEEECASLVARVVAGVEGDGLLAEAARQLVKACFYPEFKLCRDSFREAARDGACRRQQLERARGRISGSHCVDCPHWVTLQPAEHVRFLTAEWRSDPADFTAHREIFLPEDFRVFRRWLYAAARG